MKLGPDGACRTTLDPKIVARLKTYGDAFVSELVGLYRKQLDLRLAEMRRALEMQQAAELRESAHALKGSSGNLGAFRMVGLCGQLELVARSSDFTAASDLLGEIEREAEAVRTALYNQS